ncbi:MAG: asparaginase [Kordiimonadaceae bacterium]|nr:asparaginase [Kordiimonadaceae bacterium]
MSKMPIIQVFALGGTIAMTPGAAPGVTPSLSAEALVAAVPGLEKVAVIQAKTLANIGSANITIDRIAKLCAAAEAAVAAGCDGIIVTQGTDTLEESAFLASLMYKGSKPLVFTAAMRAATHPGADGPANLYNAVLVAVSGKAAGVSVVMGPKIHDPWQVSKEHTYELDAFDSSHGGPIGYIVEGAIQMHRQSTPLVKVDLAGKPAAPVALVSASFDGDIKILEALPSLGYKGVVIEAFGAGHLSEVWADAAEALLAHMPVLLATRVSEGPVLENSYGYKGAEIDLINRGLIPCGPLRSRKARLLLSLLLAEGGDWKAKFKEGVKAF